MKAADGVLFVAATFLSNFDPINFPSDRRRSDSPSVFLLQLCTLSLPHSLPSTVFPISEKQRPLQKPSILASFLLEAEGRE